jgi:hypothetical protein
VSLGQVLLASLVVAVPGLGLCLALLPRGSASPAVWAAAVIPFGYAFVGLAALLLALVHQMTRPAFFAVYAVGTVAAWGFGLRRHALGDSARAWRTQILADRWQYLMGLATILALTGVRARFSPLLNLEAQTPFRYWADGVEIADAHRIPTESLQWGHLYPPTVSKIVLNTFDGAMSMVLGRGPLGPMGALLFVGSVGVVIAAWALGRELGLRWTAPLVPILLFANHAILARELTTDLNRYHAENWGRLLMLTALIFAVGALRSPGWRQGRRSALLAGGLFGVSAGTHMVPTVIGISFVVAYALARLVLDRKPVPLAKLAGAMAVTAGVVGAFVLLAPKGDVGFQGAGDLSAYQDLATELHQPAGWDPTRYFATGRLIQKQGLSGQRKSFSSVYQQYAAKISGHKKARRRTQVLLPIGAVVAVALLLLWGSKDLKAMSMAALLVWLVLLAVAVAFAMRYRVYIFSQFGNRRLFDYGALPIVLLALGVVEMAVVRLGGVLAWLGGPRPWLTPIAAAVLLALLMAYLLPKDLHQSGTNRLSDALAPLSWIEHNVPCEGRILADRRSLATFELLTRRAGVLEGMGPYLRPELLSTAIRQMLGARAFFQDPSAGLDYLRGSGVAAVVLTNNAVPIGGTGYKVGPARAITLNQVPFLQQVARSDALVVYRVVGFQPSWGSSFPSVVGRPGFECTQPAA